MVPFRHIPTSLPGFLYQSKLATLSILSNRRSPQITTDTITALIYQTMSRLRHEQCTHP